MQIDFFAKISDSKTDRAGDSSERADHDAEGSFLVQIGQAWNSNTDSDARIERRPADRRSTASDDDPAAAHQMPSVVPDKPPNPPNQRSASETRDSGVQGTPQEKGPVAETHNARTGWATRAASLFSVAFEGGDEGITMPDTGIRGLPLRSESASASKDSQDSWATAALQSANSPGKSMEANRHGNMGDARSSQESPELASWVFSQSQAEASQTDSRVSRPPTMESPRQSLVPLASSPIHTTEIATAAGPTAGGTAVTQPREFLFEVAERIQVQLREGKGEIRIRLQPDTLGHLEIRAESTVHGVVARIMAESGSVKNYLETNLHQLQQNLLDQGLKVERIQVSIQDGSESYDGYAAQSGNSGSGPRGQEGGQSPNVQALLNAQIEELSVDSATWTALNPNSRFHTVA